MISGFKEKFLKLWAKYFPGASLPLAFYYTDDAGRGEAVKEAKGHVCFLGSLNKVIEGKTLSFNIKSVGCFGGKRYLGFSQELMEGFEYFLSCGIPGKLEGERYKKTPELVRELVKKAPCHEAPAKYIVFSRWDKLSENDAPSVVIFFAKPDVLSGLFTLANFDEVETGVITPFGAGCNTIVSGPYLENKNDRPRAVLGLFDVSARPFLPEDVLSFAVPMKKFVTMVDNMEESFLITNSWKKVRTRIKKKSG